MGFGKQYIVAIWPDTAFLIAHPMKTNMASSYTSSPRYVNDTDFDDVDSLDLDDDRDFDENFTDEGKCTEKN